MSSPLPARQPSLTPSTGFGGGVEDHAGLASAEPSRRPSAISASASEARRAKRDQLRDFYGLGAKRDGEGKESGAGVAGAGGSSGAGGEKSAGAGAGGRGAAGQKGEDGKGALDLDSPAFNANAYYDDLISRSTLSGLLQAASKMITDINGLESSRHSLVYNHHHQLFSAGDTISVLNERTPQLLGIVTALQERFSAVSQLADSAALADAPALSSVEMRLRAVERVKERLKLMIVAQDEEGAQKYWTRVKEEINALETSDKGDEQNPALQELIDECDKIAGVAQETRTEEPEEEGYKL